MTQVVREGKPSFGDISVKEEFQARFIDRELDILEYFQFFLERSGECAGNVFIWRIIKDVIAGGFLKVFEKVTEREIGIFETNIGFLV